MIGVAVSLDGADEMGRTVRRIVNAMTTAEAAALNAEAAQAAVIAARDYHLEFAALGKWKNTSLPTHGPGRESQGFGEDVAAAWRFESSDSGGAVIANGFPLFRHKVKGGTITAKRVRFLTIPLVPEAHGRRAADYAIRFRSRLFTIPGKSALFEIVQGGSPGAAVLDAPTVGRKAKGKRVGLGRGTAIRPVYALVRSVTHDPWPGAMPPTDDLAEAYRRRWLETLADLIEDA